MTSWTTPTPEQIEKAIALLAQPEQRRYFFDRLNNPLWLEPLWEKGFFKNPPDIVKDEEKKTVSFPPWPESRYLARMAIHDSQNVLRIALSVETNNIYVQEDLVDAALTMPAEMAAKLVPKVLSWMKSPYSFFRPEKFGELVSHLAKGNQIDPSLLVSKALLAVLPGEKGLLSQAKARFDAWHYERILEKNIPDLIVATGMKGFTLLCDLLESAVKLSGESKDDETGEDYSFIWRLTIEAEKHRGFHEIRALLVSAVRDAAAQIVGTSRSLAPSVITSLEQRPWKIFHRIALHVLRSFPDTEPELVRSRLTDRRLFTDRRIHREYALLLRDRFGSLRADSQLEILTWIEQGPDLEQFRENRKAWGEPSPTESESQSYAESWRLRRLRWIRDSLSTDWRQKYDALVREYGEPEDPEIVHPTEAVWIGPRTPKSEEELRGMSVSQVITYLKEWHPSEDPRAPSIEGLGRHLRNLVASKASSFVEEVSGFKEVDPTYARALLEGLHDAVGKSSFSWDAVILFGSWIMTQPRTIEGRVVKNDADRDWGPTRAVLGRLLSEGFQEGDFRIPLSLRDRAWQIIRELTNDPEPTPQYEKEFGGKNMDPVTMSINTVRGEAMHTVVRYALWLRRHIATAERGEERLAQGFNEMPEVREVLDAHLEPTQDPSLAIRAVYGEWLPWLTLIDRGWTANSLSKIFPGDARQRDHRDAAWEAYIIFCQPYNDAFDVLKREYVRSVGLIGTVAPDTWHHGDPDQHLAEHLMAFYWRGKLDLEEGGLLKSFYGKASDSLAAHAMEFIGRSLRNTEDNVETQVMERLRSLWLERLDVARRSPIGAHTREMAAFGWWFASGKLDELWALDQLHAVLSLSKSIDADWLVLEQLETLAQSRSKKVSECVELMIEGDVNGWEIHGWRDGLRKILSVVIRGNDSVARETSVRIVNRLGAKGHFEFRDLLPPSKAG